jgi:hypothetical protein
MSHSHIHAPEPQPAQVSGWKIMWILSVGFAVFAILFLAFNWQQSFRPPHITTRGKILEIRRVVDGTSNVGYRGSILYGFEARVAFTANGQPQTRWLRLSDDNGRAALTLKLAAQPSECIVYWSEHYPENVKCALP